MFDKIEDGRWWDSYWHLVSKDGKCTEDDLQDPLHDEKPLVIDVGYDLFGEDVPFEFIDKVFAVMAICPQHRFVVITKNPERMHSYFTLCDEDGLDVEERLESYIMDGGYRLFTYPLKNLWLGVTAENQEQADKRIPLLLKTPAAKRIVSVEPMLGAIGLNLAMPCDRNCNEYQNAECPGMHGLCGFQHQLDWIICGGEAGDKARPMHPDWVRGLRDQCKEAGVPFYFKQMSKRKPIPNDLKIREVPKC